MHSLFQIIGEVVGCQKDETRLLVYSFSLLEMNAAFLKLSEVVELASCVDLHFLTLDLGGPDEVHTLLGLAIEA